MNEILTELTLLAGGEGQLLALAGLFAGVLMVTMGAAAAFASRDDVERRLARAQGNAGLDGVAVRRQNQERSRSKLASFVAPSDERERLAVRRRLDQAGFRGPHAVRNYIALGFYLPPLFVRRRIHPLQLVLGPDPNQAREGGAHLPVTGLGVGSLSILPIGPYAASANFHQPRDTTRSEPSNQSCT
jgi:hypothetical protein